MEVWGVVDYTLSLDSGRLGLWPAGMLVVHAQTSYGETALANSGIISSVNHVSLLPVPGEEDVSYLSEYYLERRIFEEAV